MVEGKKVWSRQDNEPRSLSFSARNWVVWKAAAGLEARRALVARKGTSRTAEKVISSERGLWVGKGLEDCRREGQ